MTERQILRMTTYMGKKLGIPQKEGESGAAYYTRIRSEVSGQRDTFLVALYAMREWLEMPWWRRWFVG